MAETNPNGANQYQLDPRQKMCWDFYINPKSETFSNAYKSALKAGYEESTALQITTEKWFTERVRRNNMLSKAEKVLDEMLEMPIEVLEWEGRGEEAEQIVVTNPALVKVKQDTAKFVAERLGKDDGYSTRNEVTGKDGERLVEGLTKEQQTLLDTLLYDKQTSNGQSNTGDTSRESVSVQ